MNKIENAHAIENDEIYTGSGNKWIKMVQSPSGEVIDTSDLKWIISPDLCINWEPYRSISEYILEVLQNYIRHLLRNYSASYAYNQMSFLRIIKNNALDQDINSIVKKHGFITRGFFEKLKGCARISVSEENIGIYTGAFVRWYIWATDAGFEHFDPDLASEFESLRIPRNPYGQAVLSQNPNRGPLREVEMTAFRSALKAAERNCSLSYQDLALCWLMIAFGTNPRNLLLLEEEDLLKTNLEDGQVVYEIRIPRIKKGTAGDRDQFRVRTLIPEIGRIVERLIERNQYDYPVRDGLRPLFRSPRTRTKLFGTPFERKMHRCHSGWITYRLAKVAETLGLLNFEGNPLRITPRRLRYSFATRLVQDGASIHDVADALDHSSIDHVMIYFNNRSDVVRNLDRAISALLAPVAQAFMGKIIRGESQATRAGDPASRIRHRDAKTRKFEGLGSCGELGVCGLFAPLACYTCIDFQAWLEAPHELVLEALEKRRVEMLSQGADPKWTQLYDETILAVQLVMQRCAQIMAGGFLA